MYDPMTQTNPDGTAIALEEGGSFDADDAGGAPDNDGDDLGFIKQVFAYGRQKHGIQTAQGTAPGTQSEGGVRTPPAPGPLPPTSNPFGKRNTPYPAGKVAGDVVPLPAGQGLDSLAGQRRNEQRDRGIPDDDTNVVKFPGKVAGAIPDDEEDMA